VYTWAYGIKTPGLVTGGYYVDGWHGALWQNGSLTTVVYPGVRHTLLGGVNPSGLVVGNYGPFLTQHAAIYDIGTGTWTTLPDVPNLPINIGNGINAQGIAVGSAGMGNLYVQSNNVAWIWDGTTYSFFTAPGSALSGTAAGGINAPGQVSGYFQDANGAFHGFVKSGSTFTQIDVPGATDTLAYAINNRTDVAGWYVDQQFETHGFVLSGGKFTTIDVPGSFGTVVTGINENGELVGYWLDANGAPSGAFTASRQP